MFRFLLSAGLLAASVGIAQAAPKCPAGEIYRITKKVCVDKATAIRDGVLSFREKAKKRSAPEKGVRSRNKLASSTTPVSVYPGAKSVTEVAVLVGDVSALSQASIQAREDNSSAPVSRSSASANLHPSKSSTNGATSPFGALSNPWTPSVMSAPPPSRFSLQLATGD